LERLGLGEVVDLREPLKDDLEERLVGWRDPLEGDVPARASDERPVIDRVAVAGRADVVAIRAPFQPQNPRWAAEREGAGASLALLDHESVDARVSRLGKQDRADGGDERDRGTLRET